MLRALELSKAVVEESSTECTVEGRLAPSLNHLVCLWAKMPGLPCFSRSGWLAAHSPHRHCVPVAMAVPPQGSHCCGFDLCLLSWNCPSTDLLSGIVLLCFSCFLNILLSSLRNFLSGKKTVSSWPEGSLCLGFSHLCFWDKSLPKVNLYPVWWLTKSGDHQHGDADTDGSFAA